LELAASIGVTAATEQLGISRFSIYEWRRGVKLAAHGQGDPPTSGPDPLGIEAQRGKEILDSARGIDRAFWRLATADVIGDEPLETQRRLLGLASRRVRASFVVPNGQRLAATRLFLAKAVTIR